MLDCVVWQERAAATTRPANSPPLSVPHPPACVPLSIFAVPAGIQHATVLQIKDSKEASCRQPCPSCLACDVVAVIAITAMGEQISAA